MENLDTARTHDVNEQDEQATEVQETPKQQAGRVEREARARLTKIHEEERRRLEEALAEYRANLIRWTSESIEMEMTAAIEASVRIAVRRAGSRDVMMMYPPDIARLIGHGTLAKMRAETLPGELPMLVLATSPNAGEKIPKAPVLLVIDISEKLGWSE